MQDVSSDIAYLLFLFLSTKYSTFNEIYLRDIIIAVINTFMTGHVTSMALCGHVNLDGLNTNSMQKACHVTKYMLFVNNSEGWYGASTDVAVMEDIWLEWKAKMHWRFCKKCYIYIS